MRFFFAPFIFALFPCLVAAQDKNPVTEAVILDEQITAVQLYLSGTPMTLPIVALKAPNNSLLLQFDCLSTDIKDYLYTIQHCNADWQPSELVDNEYIDGYTEDRITNFENSLNTLTQYVHYTLALPNANMRWIKSGNYLLKIYDNSNDQALVLVRRFLVVETTKWRATGEIVRKPASVQKMDTHHELDFSIRHDGVQVNNPQQSVRAFVLQNGRWDNALGPIKPFIERDGAFVFDYQDKIVFPAGKEWRYFDMRSFNYRGEWVKSISERDNFYEVTLRTDESRQGTSYIYHGDINGRFSIENANNNETVAQCDYGHVLFSIKRAAPLEDEDVYVFGELSDWQLKPEFKMAYSDIAQAYVCEVPLKQGYYNYEYMVVNSLTNAVEEDGLEGNWHETSNVYTVLIYYHPFGERYERLMSASSVVSQKRE